MLLKSAQFSVTTCALHLRALTAISTSSARRCDAPGGSRLSLPCSERRRLFVSKNNIFDVRSQSSSLGTMNRLFDTVERTFHMIFDETRLELRL